MLDLPQSDEVYCFLDTDVLMHFTDFDQADWVSFLNTKQVYLVLPITVVHELNKHKDDWSKSGLQQRARGLLPRIAKLLVGADGPVRIREGVFLLAARKEPHHELNEYKNRAPKLEIGFDDGQKTTETIKYPSLGYNAQHAGILAQALNEEYVPKQIIEQRAEFERILKAAKGRASDYDVREFTDDYIEYLEKLEAARKREFMSKYGQRCELTFLIRNVGTAPITDLVIDLTFPAGTLVIDADDERREIWYPKSQKHRGYPLYKGRFLSSPLFTLLLVAGATLTLPAFALRTALPLPFGLTTTSERLQILRPGRRSKLSLGQRLLLNHGPQEPESAQGELAQQRAARTSFGLSACDMCGW